MHPSSVSNMTIVRDRYLDVQSTWSMLDVGGRKHSYRELFREVLHYAVADILDGDGVTHVMPSPFELPFPDDKFDLVVSGQMLEHCSNPFRSIAEMVRVLKPGSTIALIAPSAGPRHDVQDGWRFMDDAFRFIAAETGLETIADWIDTDAPDARSRKWQDHVFVGRKPV